jgi:predicted small lipoprotein YifL
MKNAHLAVVICLGGILLGCGQKGPLVMPDAQKHKRTVPAPPSAPAKPASGGDGSSAAPSAPNATSSPTPAAAQPAPVDSTPHP